MLEMRCAAGSTVRCRATICARAAAQDSPDHLGGYRCDYPPALLGCLADIQRSEAEDVDGCEVRSRATGVGLRAAPARATAGAYVGGSGLDARWRGRTVRRSRAAVAARGGPRSTLSPVT